MSTVTRALEVELYLAEVRDGLLRQGNVPDLIRRIGGEDEISLSDTSKAAIEAGRPQVELKVGPFEDVASGRRMFLWTYNELERWLSPHERLIVSPHWPFGGERVLLNKDTRPDSRYQASVIAMQEATGDRTYINTLQPARHCSIHGHVCSKDFEDGLFGELGRRFYNAFTFKMLNTPHLLAHFLSTWGRANQCGYAPAVLCESVEELIDLFTKTPRLVEEFEPGKFRTDRKTQLTIDEVRQGFHLRLFWPPARNSAESGEKPETEESRITPMPFGASPDEIFNAFEQEFLDPFQDVLDGFRQGRPEKNYWQPGSENYVGIENGKLVQV